MHRPFREVSGDILWGNLSRKSQLRARSIVSLWHRVEIPAHHGIDRFPAPTGRTVTKTPGETQIRTPAIGARPGERHGSSGDEVRSHYDLSNEFFRLWQDPTQTYSCAYFERDDMTLQEAQIAKIDLALGKLGLQPGMTLLDIGCGWGSTMMRAIERYNVNVIGLTLSYNQKEHIERLFAESDNPLSKQVRLQPWEEFDEPVDRCVDRRFRALRLREVRLVLQKDLRPHARRRCDAAAHDRLDEQGGGAGTRSPDDDVAAALLQVHRHRDLSRRRIPLIAQVEEHATNAGFNVTRIQRLRPHYVRTLDAWAANLEARKDEAVAITSEEVYERYLKLDRVAPTCSASVTPTFPSSPVKRANQA